ncbi:MAG TPA: DUF2784 domain-containing protein [Casimicrobiaceae bacterium]|nr:DUF2784 domain-containing protein [Casimicrobiaceae bacterium]
MFRVAAAAVLLLHAAFVLFAVFGGLLAWRWRWVAWLHLPAVAWAAFVEFTGRVCPLTPLENALRREAGETAYRGDFIGNYVGSLLYPEGLTPPMQALLGVAVVAINVAIYAAMLRQRAHERAPAKIPREPVGRGP